MEIEVGDYIRTKDGIIAKVKKKVKYIVELETTTGETRNYIVEEISKYSKNIVELIEVGDFIDRRLITESTLYALYSLDGELYVKDRWNDFHTIRTVLTHEQYEKNCYRLED